jgi:hypothetical protein
MAIMCIDKDWRSDLDWLSGVWTVDFCGPNLTDQDFETGRDFELVSEIQGELEDAQRRGLSHVLFLHGDPPVVAGETTIGELVRGEVLHLISWDLVFRAKCRVYKDAVLAAIRPPLNEVERSYFERLQARVERIQGAHG